MNSLMPIAGIITITLGIIILLIFFFSVEKIWPNFFFYCQKCKITRFPASRMESNRSCKRCGDPMQRENFSEEVFLKAVKLVKIGLILACIMCSIAIPLFLDVSLPVFYFFLTSLFILLGATMIMLVVSWIGLKKQMNRWQRELSG